MNVPTGIPLTALRVMHICKYMYMFMTLLLQFDCSSPNGKKNL